MYVALTWNTDAAHARLHRWQVHVLDRWAREDDRPGRPGRFWSGGEHLGKRLADYLAAPHPE